MARPAQDPDRPNNTAVATKVPPAAAERVIELASSAGLTRSEWVRQAVLDALERDAVPP
jgi:hypothetical protein